MQRVRPTSARVFGPFSLCAAHAFDGSAQQHGAGSTRALQTHVLFPDQADLAFFLHDLKRCLPDKPSGRCQVLIEPLRGASFPFLYRA
jgi:hypothetical protein